MKVIVSIIFGIVVMFNILVVNAAALPMKEYYRSDYGVTIEIPQELRFGKTLPNCIANAMGNGFNFQMGVASVGQAKGTHDDLRLCNEIVHDMFVNSGSRVVLEKIISLNDQNDGYLMILTKPIRLQNGQTLHLATFYINVIRNGWSYTVSYNCRLSDADYYEGTFMNSFRSLYID